jgi:AcrR family transcriptional regulator
MVRNTEVARRAYRSPLRAAQAGQTRLAILAVATRLFEEQGWAGTGMRDIARAAQVSVETVYANFGSKAQLLKQAVDMAIVGDDEPVPLNERPEFLALSQGDLSARAAATGRLLAGLRRRGARLERVVEQAAPSDPELAALLDAGWGTQRHDLYAGLAAVAQREPTKAEVDEMFAVLSSDVYLLLTETCGWTDDAYQSWVATTVVRLLNLQGE